MCSFVGPGIKTNTRGDEEVIYNVYVCIYVYIPTYNYKHNLFYNYHLSDISQALDSN